MVSLESLWVFLSANSFWHVLDMSGACFACVLECQRAPWTHFEANLERLGRILERLQRVLEPSCRHLFEFFCGISKKN